MQKWLLQMNIFFWGGGLLLKTIFEKKLVFNIA